MAAKALKGPFDGEYIRQGRGHANVEAVKGNGLGIASSLQCPPAPGLAGQHLSHGAGRQPVEVTSVSYVAAGKGLTMQVRFVDEGRRIEQGRGAGASNLMSEATKLPVDAREQPIGRLVVSLLQCSQVSGKGDRRRHSFIGQDAKGPPVHR